MKSFQMNKQSENTINFVWEPKNQLPLKLHNKEHTNITIPTIINNNSSNNINRNNTNNTSLNTNSNNNRSKVNNTKGQTIVNFFLYSYEIK